MFDREIVASIVEGDPAGLAAAYDQYARGLYAYCRSLLGEPEDAADAVQDTFIIAVSKVSALREPERLRAWLFAVARNECHRKLRARALSAPLDEAADMTPDVGDLGVDAEKADLRALVWAALSGLNPSEREIIELNLRHELDGADLADALGVQRNQAHALASRARSQFETSLGVLLVARSGREYCADLAAILEGWDGELTVLMRKRVNRHIDRCDVCGERRREELNPAMLLGLLPVAMLPAGLREEVFHLVADISPEGETYRAQVEQEAEPFGSAGFPVPLSSPIAARSQSSYMVAAVAGVGALVLLGGVLFVLLGSGGGARATGATGPIPGSGGGGGTTGLVASPAAASPAVTPKPSPKHSTQPSFTTPMFTAPVAAGSAPVVLPKPTPSATKSASSKPTKPSSKPTTPSSKPTTPSSKPTTPSSDPTTPSTDPTTPSTDPTTPSTDPTTPSTDPTTPSTDPTTPSTDTTTPPPSDSILPTILPSLLTALL